MLPKHKEAAKYWDSWQFRQAFDIRDIGAIENSP
jgi:hypothetical protein